MSHSPSGDVSSTTPQDFPKGPLDTLESELSTIWAVLDLVLDDPQEFIEGIVEDVLRMPPEKRFTESMDVVEEHARNEFGSVDAFRSQIPTANPEKMRRLFRTLFEKLQKDTLQGVFHHRKPTAHLVLVAAYQMVLDATEQISETKDNEEQKRLFSTLFALVLRIYDLSATEEADENEALEELALDVQWANFVLRGESAESDPRESDIEATDDVRIFGSMIAYAELNISVNRGAELAQTSTDEFEKMLQKFGVRPRYGPESVEDLHRDSVDE
jgi:hypothetical protein